MFKKIMGNIFQNDGQRFLKIRAMIFQTMGNVFGRGSGDYKQTKKSSKGKSLEPFMSQSDRKPEITQRSQRPEPQPQRLLQLPQPS